MKEDGCQWGCDVGHAVVATGLARLPEACPDCAQKGASVGTQTRVTPYDTAANAETPGATDADTDAGEWLAAFAERLGDKSARFLGTLVTMNASKGFVSLDELATELGVDRSEVDGWNRNLGRSINAVSRDYGQLRPEQTDGTAQLFDFEQRDDVWVYEVPAEFRQALLDGLEGDSSE